MNACEGSAPQPCPEQRKVKGKQVNLGRLLEGGMLDSLMDNVVSVVRDGRGQSKC